MDRELLMLHGARYAVLKLLDKGGVNYAKRLDGSLQMIKWTDICDYLTEKIDNYKVDKEDAK